jgi:lipoyl(octanoyl) transferase
LAPPELHGIWLGRRGYAETYQLQCRLLELRRNQQLRDVLLLLEHEPTITSGKGGHASNIRAAEDLLAQRGVVLQQTDRGGDVTVHAPGQLVAYPIVELPAGQRDVRKYVRGLAEVMRKLVARHGIDAGSIDAYIGLWADAKSIDRWPGAEHAQQAVKLGAIGVRISRWVTMHGFALNYATDMSLFQLIVPCGISSLGVASVQQLRGSSPTPAEEAPFAHRFLAEQFSFAAGSFESLTSTPLEELPARLQRLHTSAPTTVA